MTDSMHEGFVSALMIGEFDNDRMLMHDVFRRLRWRLFEARDRRRAMDCLGRHPVQVVLAEGGTSRWNWRRVLTDLRHLKRPPQLIVTSRIADDSLWAEALNMGAYDVLARPFEADEVERVVASARRHFDVPERARLSFASAEVA
jgi:DNA-binding response OmpR family regulator